MMHTFGGIDTSVSFFNTEIHVLVNSVFNMGVTCFILLSGYFGIRFDFKKLIRLDLMIIFFTIFGTIAVGNLGIKALIKSCIPVISRYYWFISCYFFLCFLTPFLNQIPEKLSKENFEKLLYDNGNSKAEVAFLDTYWRTIFESGNLQTDKIREELMKGHKLLGGYRAGELLIEPLGNTGLYTVMACPSVFSTEVLNSMYSVLTVMLIISILLCVGVASHVGRNMTRPVERMNTAMRTLQEGDLTVRIASDREDELGQMSRNFNIMANELEQNVQEKIEKQKELNASHIAMMQAQLNPHFLYNTLDTMKWVAKANHIPEIATMAAGLAKILRTSISKRQFICLREELELVNCYVDIQKIRFNDKFSYSVEMEEGLEDCVIPKLIIQPIVENSVLHGLKESEEGNIHVRITGKTGVLCIEVTDDGCGAPDDLMEAINHRRQEQLVGHIGVSNVDTILRLTYGEEYGIYMEKSDGNIQTTKDGKESGGTRVTLRLPVRREKA